MDGVLEIGSFAQLGMLGLGIAIQTFVLISKLSRVMFQVTHLSAVVDSMSSKVEAIATHEVRLTILEKTLEKDIRELRHEFRDKLHAITMGHNNG